MIRRPPRSTRTAHSFPTRRSSDLKTALADAEVEYHDHVSTTIWVRFPVVASANPLLDGASVLIWTTTPWTIPGNRAVAFGEEIAYGVWRVDAADRKSTRLNSSH